MGKLYDLDKKFEYEKWLICYCNPSRFSKIISHLEFFKQTSTVRGEIKKLPYSHSISYIIK